ncbi:MAG: hypothetical protein KF715_14010 [Candidatus Didemnitutus sp.]|nr:hypothetical protein [Candidatus Didemnitutus sp.]
MKLSFPKMASRTVWLAALWLLPLASAEAAKPAADADAVLDRWVEASGGAKRLKAIQQSDYHLRLAFGPSVVLDATGTALASGPHRLVMQTPAGEVTSADDGRIAWVHHASLGGRVLEPDRAERDRRTTGPAEALRVKRDYPQRLRLPDEQLDGKTVRVVELTDACGWKERWYFNGSTGLRVRREQLDEEKGGTVDYADFRKVNGIVEPFRAQMRMRNGSGSSLEVLAATHATKVTAERWVPPEGLEADSRRIDEAVRKFQTAMGSKEAFAKIKTRVTRARVEVPASGISAAMSISIREPDRILIEQDVPGMGRMLQGFDGKTGWAWGEMQGYRELHGAELVQLAATAKLAPRIGGDEAPLRRIVNESTDADGHAVLAVDFSTVAGSTGICHFDLETGLLVKVETLLQTGPGSTFKAVMELSDYREVDGVKVAFVQAVSNPAMRVVTRLLEVEHNRELADELFLPRKNGEIPVPADTAKPADKGAASEPVPRA